MAAHSSVRPVPGTFWADDRDRVVVICPERGLGLVLEGPDAVLWDVLISGQGASEEFIAAPIGPGLSRDALTGLVVRLLDAGLVEDDGEEGPWPT
jgi:hypothetical protein